MKRNDSKEIKRVKKLYPVYKCGEFINSITEFLSLKWVKKFKKVGKFKKHPLEKQWLKQLNKRKRTSAKKEIQEGIQEYEDMYTESTCDSCEHLIGKTCTKHYISYPENTCNDFRE